MDCMVRVQCRLMESFIASIYLYFALFALCESFFIFFLFARCFARKPGWQGCAHPNALLWCSPESHTLLWPKCALEVVHRSLQGNYLETGPIERQFHAVLTLRVPSGKWNSSRINCPAKRRIYQGKGTHARSLSLILKTRMSTYLPRIPRQRHSCSSHVQAYQGYGSATCCHSSLSFQFISGGST